MKKHTLLNCGLLFAGLLMGACTKHATPDLRMETASTFPVEETDTPEMILEKAAHVVPNDRQWQALQNEFIAFIHFGPNTFTRMEWGNGMEDPHVFDLKTLDTDQWCRAMKAAGMKMVIFTAKHHDGFVLWQSRYTTHGIMSTGFRDGKGDVLKDLSASCRKYGLKLGIYLSPADLYQIENPEGLYGNLSQYTRRGIPREVPGRPFANKTTFEFELDDYNEYFMNQLFELLTEYGPIHEVWFDGAHPKQKGGQKYNYAAWKKLIHTLAPEAVIFGREDVRWCGNESGRTRSTEWNVVPYAENPDTTSHFPDMTNEDLGSREALAKGKYLHYQQAETNTSIREGWFYRDDERQQVRSADDVFDIYERAVGGNSTFLLNIPPNREGQFSDRDVKVLEEVGKRITQTYGTNLLQGAKGAASLLDDDETTIEVMGEKGEWVFETKQPVTVNRFRISEAVKQSGERVEAHALDAWIDGKWQEIASGTNIGYKRILRFADVTTNRFRLRILSSRLKPALATVSAHHYASRPPRLEVKRAADGRVSIGTLKQNFGWKTYEQDIARDLNAGLRIHYTTDGTEPDARSTEYTEPFVLETGEVKAVAILNGESGEVCRTQLGYLKKDWQIKAGNAGVITLQPEKPCTISGLIYVPRTDGTGPMLVKGKVLASNNGTAWQELGTFEFGNLKNDPTRRTLHLDNKAEATFVRIEMDAPISKDAAEIELF